MCFQLENSFHLNDSVKLECWIIQVRDLPSKRFGKLGM